jgi:transposase-like protein
MKKRRKEMEKNEVEFDEGTKAIIEKLASDFSERISRGEKVGIGSLFEALINELMIKDRDSYLSRVQTDEGNGFYKRDLALSMGKLRLKVPRVRFGINKFRPAILPARWKRVDKEYEEFLIALLANNYSQSQIKRACRQLGLPFSQEALNDALALIEERLEVFKTQIFNNDWFAVFIDAYHARLRAENNRVNEISIFSAMGINMDGEKQILGYWICKGRENKGFWVQVLQDLITRGIKRVMLFVTDNFSGLCEVINKLYPYSDHQLCYVHLMRNISRALNKKNSREAVRILKLAKSCANEEEGALYWQKLCEIIREEKPEMADYYNKYQKQYLTFLNYPHGARKYIYTTNIVESVNSGIERMRINMGGYFPSRRSLDVNLFIQLVNIQDFWEKRTIPGLKESLYEIRQLFALKFEMRDN